MFGWTLMMRPLSVSTSDVIQPQPFPALASSSEVPAAGSPVQIVALRIKTGLVALTHRLLYSRGALDSSGRWLRLEQTFRSSWSFAIDNVLMVRSVLLAILRVV